MVKQIKDNVAITYRINDGVIKKANLDQMFKFSQEKYDMLLKALHATTITLLETTEEWSDADTL